MTDDPSTAPSNLLTWIHFGDLHASDEDRWKSVRDLRAMVLTVNQLMPGAIDFAFLPGDNANHGEPAQYRLISRSMARLHLPWHAIPGDHDFEADDLEAFHTGLHVQALPYCAVVRGRRCLFLDIVSHGNGGPDFRLGAEQTRWLRQQLEKSGSDQARPVVFMHAFPGDLAEDGLAIAETFAERGVVCVDTGHTHYNELVNDGSVIYTATRSTGQIEEGRVGFSVHAVDGNAVSWRFKDAARPWPFVLITSPVDVRLVTDRENQFPVPFAPFIVRAKVLGRNMRSVFLRCDGDEPVRMQAEQGLVGVWSARLAGLADGRHQLTVLVEDDVGGQDSDAITVNVSRAMAPTVPARKDHLGEDMHSIGEWPEHGLLGSQLGPNKNGKKW